MKTWKAFTCYSLVVAFIFFASIARVDAANADGGSNPLYDVEQIPATIQPWCTNTVELAYGGGAISANFLVGAQEATTWSIYLAVFDNVIPVFSVELPAFPPQKLPVEVPVTYTFPSSGVVGVLTTLSTSGGGIICSDWATVDTGSTG